MECLNQQSHHIREMINWELGLMVNCMANRPNVQNHTQKGLLATVLQLMHKIYICGMIWIIIIMYVLYYNKKKISC